MLNCSVLECYQVSYTPLDSPNSFSPFRLFKTTIKSLVPFPLSRPISKHAAVSGDMNRWVIIRCNIYVLVSKQGKGQNVLEKQYILTYWSITQPILLCIQSIVSIAISNMLRKQKENVEQEREEILQST